jgi:hypothetical protein
MVGYQHLAQLSVEVGDRMNQLQEHLDSIIKCLLAIEDRLRASQSAVGQFKKKEGEKKKKIIATRLIFKAEELIQACNIYLTMTERKRGITKAIDTDNKKSN